MQEQKVDRPTEFLDAGLGGALQIAVVEAVRPDLGGKENFITGDGAGRDGVADVLLILVDIGRVDVPVAGVDRLAMLKYGMPDLRPYFEADVEWIKHYGFKPWLLPTVAGGLS